LLLSAFLAGPAAAEVTVRVVPAAGATAAHVELTARAAPLAEVLDRLGRQIGMKVVYEGATPRQLVTLSLQGRTPAETVLGLLEGQGLNFALVSDPTGTRVETLLVAGSAPQTPGASSASAPGRSMPSPAFRRPLSPPPGSGPDSMEADPEELADDEAFDDPANGAPEGADAGGQAEPPPTNPVPTPQAPVQGQRMEPSPSFPVSPFAPQASPYAPQPQQPFPPLPPGVPGGPTTPTTPPQQETTGQPPPD
jgi:hypothetical protein